MSRLNVYFDLDDTLLATRKVFLERFKELGCTGIPVDEYLTNANTGGLIDYVIGDATFMTETELHVGMGDMLTILQTDYRNHVNVSFCTHRGYHPEGEFNTKVLMQRLGLKFHEEIFLNPKVHPDKLNYLKNGYFGDLMLFDDNPYYGDVHYDDPDVYLMDVPWNQQHNVGSKRVYTAECILNKIETRLTFKS